MGGLKLVVLFSVAIAAIVTICLAAPVEPDQKGRTFLYEYDEADENKTKHEIGYQRYGYLEVEGRYSFKDKDGVTYQVSYTADRYGYHPSEPEVI